MILKVDTLKKPLIYVIDDDTEILNLLRKLFILENYRVETFLSAIEAMKALERQEKEGEIECRLILCDLKLPDMDGLEFISQVHQRDWDIPVIFITAHGSVETAVDALKKGAFDYVIKPLNLAELRIITSRAIQFQNLKDDRKSLQKQLNEQLKKNNSLGPMIGKSKAIQQVFDLIRRVARTTSNVLITGESGTGKEMVARAIHQNSLRQSEPFIAINCSAIPDQLLESELFGHKKGAFTGAHENHVGLFEEAKGGTLFLDEIGDMPLGLQVKLLRVLQERKIRPVGDSQLKDIDVRIIAATHKNIRGLIQEGKFREDLYYRLCVIPIHIPSLRERKDDIPLIAEHFLKKFCDRNETPVKKLTKTALAKLIRMPWPGNVRELENLLERAVVLSDQEWIEEENLQIEMEEVNERPSTSPLFTQLVTLEELEQSYIRHVLEVTGYSKEKASEILGINRKTLYRKELELQQPRKP